MGKMIVRLVICIMLGIACMLNNNVLLAVQAGEGEKVTPSGISYDDIQEELEQFLMNHNAGWQERNHL